MGNKVDFNIEYAHICGSESISTKFITEEQRQSVEEAKRITKELESRGKTYSLCVLVDDYNEPVEIEEQNVYSELMNLGLAPDYVARESQVIEGAEVLLNALPDKFKHVWKEEIEFVAATDDLHLWAHTNSPDIRSFKEILLDSVMGRENKVDSDLKEKVTITRESMKSKIEIALRYRDKKELKYSCPLMTASWHLMRLGVEPFSNNTKSIKTFPLTRKPFVGERLITILPANYLKVEGTAMEIISLAKTKTISKVKKRIGYIFF